MDGACLCDGWFQSLLLWISLIGQGSAVAESVYRREFQSLLLWISLIGFKRGMAGMGNAQVSILVVVDQPHRPC